jgi:TonB family protein
MPLLLLLWPLLLEAQEAPNTLRLRLPERESANCPGGPITFNDTLPLVLYVTAPQVGRPRPVERAFRDTQLQEIAQRFSPPAVVSVPALQRAGLYVTSEGHLTQLPELTGEVRFSLRRDASIEHVRLLSSTDSRELDERLLQAVARAGADHAFAPLPSSISGQRLEFAVRASTVKDTTMAALPVMRVALPYLRVDEPVQVITIPTPEWPREARNLNVEDVLDLQYVVDEFGHTLPGSLRVVRGGYREFGEAAAEALARAEFTPAKVRGCPVAQLVQQRIQFRRGH